MSECTQCPHVVGDSDQRDCGFPDCSGGWEEVFNDQVARNAELEAKAEKDSVEMLKTAISANAYMRTQQAKITELQAVVEEAINSIEWYRAEHPESDTSAADELLDRAREALTQSTGTPE